MFQTKDFLSIVASIINHMRATQRVITDFNVGGVGRTLVEAPAIEIDQLYQEMAAGLTAAIPVAVYNSFSFAAEPARPAAGLLRVNITAQGQAVLIPAGTVFTRSDQAMTYTSTADKTIAAGDTFADVPVVADQAGSLGNLPAGGTFTASPQPTGFVSATNPARLTGGQEKETEPERRLRFNAFIASLPRGTIDAIDYGLRTVTLTDANGLITERVVHVALDEPYRSDPVQPVAWVRGWIHNGVGTTSSDLVQRARLVVHGYTDAQGNKVPGWKAAGVRVDIEPAAEVAVDVAGTLTLAPNADEATVLQAAEQAIFAYVRDLGLGAPFIRAEVIARVMALDGVVNFLLDDPSADQTTEIHEKLMPGAIALTVA